MTQIYSDPKRASASTQCDCGHGRLIHNGATLSNDGGNECRKCDCPLYQRASEPHALPDVEVFHHEHAKRERMALNAGYKAELYGECIIDDDGDCGGTGWYWQSCFP